MAIRNSTAEWKGTLKEGSGTMKYGDVEGSYTFSSRFEEGDGTNPEELVGAAHAGCYSMFLSALLSGDDLKLSPVSIKTTAKVTLGEDDGPKITNIDLTCEAEVPGIEDEAFQKQVTAAKEKCPISRLYAGTAISVTAKLV